MGRGQELDRALELEMASQLKPLGFKNSGGLFVRVLENGDCIGISLSNSVYLRVVAFPIGFLHVKAIEVATANIRGEKYKRCQQGTTCLGVCYFRDRHDLVQWTIEDFLEIPRSVDEILAMYFEYAVPWLEKMQADPKLFAEHALTHYNPVPFIYDPVSHALAICHGGYVEEARKYVHEESERQKNGKGALFMFLGFEEKTLEYIDEWERTHT